MGFWDKTQQNESVSSNFWNTPTGDKPVDNSVESGQVTRETPKKTSKIKTFLTKKLSPAPTASTIKTEIKTAAKDFWGGAIQLGNNVIEGVKHPGKRIAEITPNFEKAFNQEGKYTKEEQRAEQERASSAIIGMVGGEDFVAKRLGAGKIPKAVLNFFSKETNPEIISKNLQTGFKVSKDVADDLGSKLAATRTVDEVKNTLLNYGSKAETKAPGFWGDEQKVLAGDTNVPTKQAPSVSREISSISENPNTSIKAAETSRFKTGDEIITTIDRKGAGMGYQLNKTEIKQLVDHLTKSADGNQTIKTWGGDTDVGTVYKSYGGGKDIVIGKVSGRGGDSMLVAQINENGKLDGRFRTHATPIKDENIIAKYTPNELLEAGSAESAPTAKQQQPALPDKSPQAILAAAEKKAESLNPIKGFENSQNQKIVARVGEQIFEIGDYGRNAIARKIAAEQPDRLPDSEMAASIKEIAESYRAGDTSFRKDNVVHIARMPGGEVRAIVTRQNKAGNQEVINFFKIGRDVETFINNLKRYGTSGGTRTHKDNVRTIAADPSVGGNRSLQQKDTKSQEPVTKKVEAPKSVPEKKPEIKDEKPKPTETKKPEESVKKESDRAVREEPFKGDGTDFTEKKKIGSQISDEGVRMAPRTPRLAAIAKGEIKPGEKLPSVRSIPGNKVILPEEMQTLDSQIRYLRDSLLDDPARELQKYFVNRGEFAGQFPEVTGGEKASYLKKTKSKDVLDFAKRGDEIVTEFGYKTPEEAEEAAKGYMRRVGEIREMEKEFRIMKRDYIMQERERVALNNLAESAGKDTGKLQEVERKRKIFEKAVDNLKAEAMEKSEKLRKITEALQSAPQGPLGFFKKLNQALFPIKYVENKTKNILLNWNRKILKARTLADKEVGKLNIPETETMQTIFKYEQGQYTPHNDKIKKVFNDLFVEARSRGIDLGFEGNYIPHVYKEKPADIMRIITEYLVREKGMSPSEAQAYLNGGTLSPETVKRLKLRPRFSKERTFPTYEQAMNAGLTPKYTNLDQLVAYYREELEKTVANRELIDDLTGEGLIMPVEVAPDHWVPVNLPFSHKGYYAEERFAKLLNGIFRDQAPQTFGEAVAEKFGTLSRRAQEIALSAGFPKTSINFFSIGQLIKQITAGEFKALSAFIRANSDKASINWFRKNQDYLQMMSEEGIDLGSTVASFPNLYKNLVAKKKISEIAGDTFDELFNDKTFGSFMPQLYTQTFKSIYDGAVKKGMEHFVAKRLAGDTTRRMFGMNEFTGRSRPVENTMSSLFFAPKFREGIINTLVNTGKSFTSKIKDPSYKLNRRLFMGMVITYAAYNLLNKELNGEYMWDNPKNRKFALRIPTKDGSMYIEFMPSFLAFARNMLSGAMSLVGGDLKNAGQKFGSVFSMPIKVAVELLTNQDYFGNPIYNEDDSSGTKALKAAKYTGLAVNHPYIEELINQLQDKKPLYQSIIIALEMPLKFTSTKSEQTTEFYNALDKIQEERKNIKKEIETVYDEVEELLANDNEDAAQELLNERFPDTDKGNAEFEIYKDIRTARKRSATLKAQPEMYQIVKQLRELNKTGDDAAIDEIMAREFPDTPEGDERYRIYELTAAKIPEGSAAAETDVPELETDTPLSKKTVLKTVVDYARAIGVDPATAFKAMFTSEQLKYVKGKVVVLERIPFTGEKGSEAIARQRAEAQGVDRSSMKLDHIIPLQMGGDNGEDNLDLITTEEWEKNTPIENHLGELLRSKKLNRKRARDLITKFKSGEIDADYIYSIK